MFGRKPDAASWHIGCPNNRVRYRKSNFRQSDAALSSAYRLPPLVSRLPQHRFLMWQSKTWNGQEAAFRVFVVLDHILLYISSPENEPELAA